jgi:hypothetical protein
VATTETDAAARAEAPTSIYFGLQQGDTANLEVIAEAAIAWVASIREMAHVIDPGLNVTVEILDGERSSLWLNTITAIEQKLDHLHRQGEQFPRLWALARGLAFIVIATPLQVTAEDVWRHVSDDNPAVVTKLSPEDRRELIDDFKKALREDVAQPEKKAFFRSAEKDTSIMAVGVSDKPRREPKAIVRREQFTAYVAAGTTEETVENNRKRTETWEVTLVSPVLENTERSWRFIRAGMPEFGAVMRDKAFLEAIEGGGVHEELRKGIQMIVEIQFRERFEDGVWMTLDRSVLRVIQPSYDRGGLGF